MNVKPLLKAPFPWFGGKSRAAELVWERFGNVPNYVEPFAGSLAVLLQRPHEPNLETINDKDCYLANFWRAVQQEPEAVASSADWPVHEVDLHARHRWLVEQTEFWRLMQQDPLYYDTQIAGWWVWGVSLWIGSGWCDHPEWTGRASVAGKNRCGVHGKKPRIDRGNGCFVHAKRPLLGHKGRGVANWRQRPDLANGCDVGIHRKRPQLGNRSIPGVHRKQLPALFGNKGLAARREWLYDWMQALADRLRGTRVCCGDWKRVITPAVTWKIGGAMLTGMLLDPPYDMRKVRGVEYGSEGAAPTDRLYFHHDHDLSAEVREWALANAGNPLLRIALCGYEGEHEMPAEWECVEWKANGGYSNRTGGLNAARERIWFSPHCLKPLQASLF